MMNSITFEMELLDISDNQCEVEIDEESGWIEDGKEEEINLVSINVDVISATQCRLTPVGINKPRNTPYQPGELTWLRVGQTKQFEADSNIYNVTLIKQDTIECTLKVGSSTVSIYKGYSEKAGSLELKIVETTEDLCAIYSVEASDDTDDSDDDDATDDSDDDADDTDDIDDGDDDTSDDNTDDADDTSDDADDDDEDTTTTTVRRTRPRDVQKVGFFERIFGWFGGLFG
jgi:hypothetical protein